jgi:hypothetical protein
MECSTAVVNVKDKIGHNTSQTARKVPLGIRASSLVGWLKEEGFPRQVPFSPSKYLWGNTPACNILNVKDKEGNFYQQELKLCFAGT